MAIINGLDTNDQSNRDKLRDQGYYIDNSGVYAPGAGNKVTDTWSGSNASKNTAPQGPNLPILNGTPVSPSNGFTGPQTNAIMYRGDPLYQQYFGAGTPGFDATSKTYNATPGALPSGQQTFQGMFGNNGLPQAPVPAANVTDTTATGAADQTAASTGTVPLPDGYTPGSNTSLGSLTASDAQTLGAQSQETQTAFHSAYGDNAEQAFVQQHNAAINSPASSSSAPVQAAAASAPPTTTTQTPPQTQAPAGGQKQMAVLPGGGGVVDLTGMPPDQAEAVRADLAKAAQQLQAAQQFTQGLEQQKFDLSKMVDQATIAYNNALIDSKNRELAQTAAYQAMQIELQKQNQQLQGQAQAQQMAIAMQQTENQRASQSNQLSLQREQLDVQRSQMRAGRRPAVRYA